MIKIIKNNYIPKTREVTYKGYEVTCPECGSELFVEQSEVYTSNWYGEKAYHCPCCKQEVLLKNKKYKEITEIVNY